MLYLEELQRFKKAETSQFPKTIKHITPIKWKLDKSNFFALHGQKQDYFIFVFRFS